MTFEEAYGIGVDEALGTDLDFGFGTRTYCLAADYY